MDKMMHNQIGFKTPAHEANQKASHEERLDLIERRLTALENKDGNYQEYLKMKEKFEK
ncbi:hypothetical protein [Alicyclobacillus sp. SO9]|uniref:hypothetical protein n=1 Tax=Alicyclobacillus sp. SO9 TaxID=2665646 RepID=UPI0018E71E39|nr:hypothetical protein [Alicyclobacillus sp. SO9]QQE80916.1 hypothetical protein GI364_11325 [Alicyclobacillus sp. SO9]